MHRVVCVIWLHNEKDQEVIVSLQDRLHEMPGEVQKKGIPEGQNKESSDKRSVLIHYMEMVSSQMKRKEHPSCLCLFNSIHRSDDSSLRNRSPL